MWFSDDPGDIRLAQLICQEDCPVRLPCAALGARTKNEYGVWGGYAPHEMKKISKAYRIREKAEQES